MGISFLRDEHFDIQKYHDGFLSHVKVLKMQCVRGINKYHILEKHA